MENYDIMISKRNRGLIKGYLPIYYKAQMTEIKNIMFNKGENDYATHATPW